MAKAAAVQYAQVRPIEHVVTGLSNLRWFPVIAWNSMTPFRHSALQPDQVGRALGARYLLSGSMRIANEELRVSTSLVDAGSGVLHITVATC